MGFLDYIKKKWKGVILIALIVLIAFCVGIMATDRLNWRVFVLHDSERVTIKVK